MAHPSVATVTNPLARRGEDRVILVALTKLTDDEKHVLKDLRGSNGGYFTWSGAFAAYSAQFSDDLALRAEQFAHVYDARRSEGVVKVENVEKTSDKAAARVSAAEQALAALAMTVPSVATAAAKKGGK